MGSADWNLMSADGWTRFCCELRARHTPGQIDLQVEYGAFREFVAQVPEAELIELLLYAYERYWEISSCGEARNEDYFESSCQSILISTILDRGVHPNESQAVAILGASHHNCGHGSDVEPPLNLAEQAFQDRPYSVALFDAAAKYRAVLKSATSQTASNVKRRLYWLQWHDPRHIEKLCWTRRIQLAIHGIAQEEAIRWQWLLRNYASGNNAAPTKPWLQVGRMRLAQLGEEEFLRRIDEWFVFDAGKTLLTGTGSGVLRLLIWYAGLVDVERSVPMVSRIAHVTWAKPEPAGKVVSALAWLLRTHRVPGVKSEVSALCRDWGRRVPDVARLRQYYL